jgi:hypothetical protein
MRIMAWNVQNFRSKRPALAGSLQRPILHALYPGVAVTPTVDVFAILEVFNRAYNTPVGAPLPAKSLGTKAVLLLNQELHARAVPGVVDWRLVPPLSLGAGGRSEGVAIFYNAAKVEYLGPNGWYGANQSQPYAEPDTTVNYPPPWNACFAVPPYYAPRINFFSGANEITFPDDSHRRPCLARFRSLDPHPVVPLVDAIFFHTSPPWHMDPESPANPAFLACRYLQIVEEVEEPTHEHVNETVVMGDFNINAAKPAQWANALGGMGGLGYLPALPTGPPAQPSMLKTKAQKIIVPPDPIPPALVDEFYWYRYAIDNAFCAPVAAPEGRIVDLAAGYPKLIWTKSIMAQTMAQIRAGLTPLVRYNTFTACRNEYQLRLVSDHAPVYIRLP